MTRRYQTYTLYANAEQHAAIEQARLAMRERLGHTEQGREATANLSAYLRYCGVAYAESLDMGAQAAAVANAALVALAMKHAADAGFDFRQLAPDIQREYLALATQDAEAVGQGLRVPA
ncbi:MAG: hypothetical protein F4Y01_16615 [Gammaproteobacteria bacterium]|nr:hypothetical protein [Gammaproteobacteria bacterium]